MFGGYPPTAIGYTPTAIGYPPTAIGCPPTAIGYPPAAIVGRIGHSEFFFFHYCTPWRCRLRRNAGATAGREVVQLYIADCESRLPRPEKELKGFAKTEELAPGEARAVRFAVTARDLSYFDDGEGQWVAESGRFEALVGASSRDIRLRGPFVFASRKTLPLRFDERTTLREWLRCPETRALAAEAVGPFFAAMGRPAADPLGGLDNNFLLDMPVIKYVYMSGGAVTEEAVRAAVAKARAVRRPL